MARLIIKRSSEWMDAMREAIIILDGEKIGILGSGQTMELRIPAGEHRLSSKMDRYGSNELIFNLTGTEDQKVELSGFRYGKWLSPVAFAILILYFGFKQQISIIYLLIVMIPIGAYFLYYMTIGRNNYLRLRKI